MNTPESRLQAQEAADRIRIASEEINGPELRKILALTDEQSDRFEEWSRAKLRSLSAQFDVDTTESQKRMSWGMRIASTLGGLAICTAGVLFFTRYWGYLGTPWQVTVLMLLPFACLAGTEYASRRERTRYFTGLMALVTLASFVLDLDAIGRIFNIASTEKALLAWGVFALLLAYRYGLRALLAVGIVLTSSYVAAALAARLGYRWIDFGDRPENLALIGLVVFAIPLVVRDKRRPEFAAVYRLVGALACFLSVLSLAEWGAWSCLPFEIVTVERVYEFAGLGASSAAIWLGIVRKWNGVVNCGSIFFAIFLFCRLYHWWWDWMPRYLFFALIGAIAIALVVGFKRMRERPVSVEGRPA